MAALYDPCPMASGEWTSTFRFEELHLLPRAIFAMGAVTFIAAVIGKEAEVALIGAGTVFSAIALNYVIVAFRVAYEDNSKHPRKLDLLGLCVFSMVLAVLCFFFSQNYHFCKTDLIWIHPVEPTTK
jgi:hypothetical protein